MAVVVSPDSAVPEPETPLLDHSSTANAHGVVDYKGRPAIRSESGRWRSASIMLAVGVIERFAYGGISSNLISYLTGPLGQPMAEAAVNVNRWSGAGLLLPVFGAFIADSFLGRYRTIVAATLLYLLGLGLLTLSAVLSSGEIRNSRIEVVLFFFSLYLVALAQAAHKPCLQAFGADQFDGKDLQESKSKGSFFNWWYFAFSGGPVIPVAALNYIQDNHGWVLGFGIPCVSMIIALVLFLLGIKTYRYAASASSRKRQFLTTVQLFARAAVQKLRKSEATEEIYLDSMNEIEEANAVLRLIPFWVSSLGFAIVNAQVGTFFTEQASTMDRSVGSSGFEIPAASLQYLVGITIVVFIPIYDRILLPLSRSVTTLERIGIGMGISVIAVITAALVEKKRLEAVIKAGITPQTVAMATVPMRVWWLVPQYVMYGIADTFAMVGLQEFFYEQVPSSLKSIGLSLYLSIFGVGSFLSSFLITFIEKVTGGDDGGSGWFPDDLNRAHLDYFYWVLAGLGMVELVILGALSLVRFDPECRGCKW